MSYRALAAAIRACGYGDTMDYNDCVLGRAYKRVTGRPLRSDGCGYVGTQPTTCRSEMLCFVQRVGDEFGIPYEHVMDAEQMCYGRIHTPEQIADWLDSLEPQTSEEQHRARTQAILSGIVNTVGQEKVTTA